MEIGDTTEEAVNINETTPESVEETEPAENAKNTEKLENKIMVSDISIFTVAVENLQFNCYQCNSKIINEYNLYHCTLCEKGLISMNHTKRHMKSLAR